MFVCVYVCVCVYRTKRSCGCMCVNIWSLVWQRALLCVHIVVWCVRIRFAQQDFFVAFISDLFAEKKVEEEDKQEDEEKEVEEVGET